MASFAAQGESCVHGPELGDLEDWADNVDTDDKGALHRRVWFLPRRRRSALGTSPSDIELSVRVLTCAPVTWSCSRLAG